METSYKFKHIENNLSKILGLIVSNQNVLKYLVYLDNKPLSHPDINEDLIGANIQLQPFDEEILSQERCTLFLNPLEGNLISEPMSNLNFTIDIVVPNKKWLLEGSGKIRVFRICDEIAQMIDNQLVAGIKPNRVTRFRIFKVGNDYSGITLWITVNSSTMKGLRKD